MPILNENGILKLPNQGRKSGGARTQNPNRHRRKWVKPSEEEREKKKQKREDKDSRFDAAVLKGRQKISELMEELHDDVPEHTADWWYQYLMQQPKFTGKQRAISKWQAFVSIEMEKRNKALMEEHGPDVHRDRVSSDRVKEEIKAKWKALLADEKDVLTADRVRELEERRENRHCGVRNLALAKFMDIRESFSSLHTQLENLRDRTGIEIFLAAVRAEHTSYNKPVIYYSSDRVRSFMEMVTNASLSETCVQMEAYCIGGAEEMVNNQVEKTLLLKARLASLILTKLKDACKRGTIKRMFYDSFDQQITAKHGVVLDSWPVSTFHSPSNMSFLEAEIVLHAFENNTTRFRSLSDSEWAAWKVMYFAATSDADDNATLNAEIQARMEEEDPAPVRVLGPASASTPVPLTSAPVSPDTTSVTPSPDSASPLASESGTTGTADSEGQSPTQTQPLAVHYINSGAPVAGSDYQVPVKKGPAAASKKRKTRSDKGTTRKKAAGAEADGENTPTDTATPAPRKTKPKPRPKKKDAAAAATPENNTTVQDSAAPRQPVLIDPLQAALQDAAPIPHPAHSMDSMQLGPGYIAYNPSPAASPLTLDSMPSEMSTLAIMGSFDGFSHNGSAIPPYAAAALTASSFPAVLDPSQPMSFTPPTSPSSILPSSSSQFNSPMVTPFQFTPASSFHFTMPTSSPTFQPSPPPPAA